MKKVKNCLRISLLLSLVALAILAFSSCFCAHEWEDNEILKEATCLAEGRAISTCKICGVTQERVLPKSEHRGKVVVTSTCTEDGYTVIDCPVCGYYEKYNIVPARGHKTEGNSIFCSRCDVVTTCENYFIKLMEYSEQDTFRFRVESLPVNADIYIISMEMIVGVDEEGALVGEGFAELRGGTDGIDIEAYIYGDTLYLYDTASETYQLVALAMILENLNLGEADSPADGSIPAVSNTVPMEELIAFLEQEIAPFIRAGEELTDGEINLRLSQVISSLFEFVNYEGYNFHLRADKLKELNERLSEETVAYFIDKEYGRGSFDYLEGAVMGMLSSSVGELLSRAVVEGLTAEEAVEKLDALAVLLSGDSEMTVSALIGAAMGDDAFDLLTVLQNEELMSKTVAELLAENAEEPTTAEALLSEMQKAFSDMREKTFYLLAEIPKEEVKATKEAYDAQIDAIFELFSFSFKGSATGELVSMTVGVPMGASVPTRLSWFFGECDAPDVGDIPQRVQSMLHSLRVENGVSVEDEKTVISSINTVTKTKIEFVSLEDGTVTAIRSYISITNFEFTKTEDVVYNGIEQTAWLYDAVEEVYTFELPLSEADQIYMKDDCGGWLCYTFFKTMPVEYTKNTFVISWIGKDYVWGDVLTSEALHDVPVNCTLGFWYNTNTQEVRFDGEWERHDYVYEGDVNGASCREESYELWVCPDCGAEEKRSLTHGPHDPVENRPYCSLCWSLVYNPEDALYIYDSDEDEVYVELFEGGEAVGYISVDGEYKMYDLDWKEENEQIVLYFFWNNRTVLTLKLVDGKLERVEG